MLAVCPSCRSTYSVRDEKIPPQGARIRCPKCQTTFVIKRTVPPQDPERRTPLPGPPGPARTAKPVPSLDLGGPGMGMGSGKPAAATSAWHVRTDSGETHRFESLGSLQSWLQGRAGTEGYQISRDNVSWRSIGALSDVVKPVARPTLADLGSKPLVAPSLPAPPPGKPGSLAEKAPVTGLMKNVHKRKTSPAVVALGILVIVVGGAHALHSAEVLDLSSVLPWLEPFAPVEQPRRPTRARATTGGDDTRGRAGAGADAGAAAGAGADAGAAAGAGADAGAAAGAGAGADAGAGGRAGLSSAMDGGATAKASLPELPIPKDPHTAIEAAKTLAKLKQWSDVVRFLEFAKTSIHKNRTLLKLLAKAYEATGRKKDAAKKAMDKYRALRR